MPSLVSWPERLTVPLCASAAAPQRSSSGVLAAYVPCPHTESLEMVSVSVTSRLPSVPVHVAGFGGSPLEQATMQQANSNALGDRDLKARIGSSTQSGRDHGDT